MIKLAHLNYYYHNEFTHPDEVIEKHKLSSGFVEFLKKYVYLVSIKHLDYEGEETISGVHYYFLRSSNRSWYIPFKTHRLLKGERPDVVLSEGFVYPLRILFLRLKLGRKPVIILQHQGEKPAHGIGGRLQKFADKYIDAYILTSLGNAEDWISRGIIRDKGKCYEVLSASTSFTPKDKAASKLKLGFTGEHNFLWVGRLNANKDPLTVLQAFEQFAKTNDQAKLYMVYQTTDLLNEVRDMIDRSGALQRAIILVGEKAHEELTDWFDASDFYISASHSEGSGYALVEAMTCGCIPVVTNIPSFNKMTSGGKYGFLYEPANVDQLVEILQGLDAVNKQELSVEIIHFARSEFSFQNIANQILNVAKTLLNK